ncbi:inovirus-type Gp2 protein [Laribacter hongkongensis]|uniref:inovirus-type Gp2 protein n=1 Tax=Laribacter hongkongensis TaxID=168471 RepID=UPI001EFD8D4C|nr:inovirus-type Gp2 protein [Laribacter hongkongensis]
MIKSIFDYGPSKLLFIRIDYGLRSEYQKSTSFFEFQEWFQKIRNNMRHNTIFKHHIALCWSLEYTHEKSYHCHALHIFDGHAVQDGVYYGNLIGEYWCNQITGGKGTYWNCNRQADNYPINGLGMISHNDWPKRQALMTHVVPYLAKPDYLIRGAIQADANALGMPHLAHKVRTYGASHPLTERRSPAGRPRIGGLPIIPQFVDLVGGI